ncbi:MAG: RNA 2',3'-cyclic phosphodiesterase [Methanobrevibacter sp.]|jgi:2'-5' RNA ligase|nr:RNA 2',3'-cyclic phosphodiesterase [Candidatus Methanoflexus mossambicus]
MPNNFRSFLAIDINDKTKSKIAILQKYLKNTDINLKYVDLDNIHLTLKFFGSINSNQLEEIKDKISIVLKNYSSFNLNIQSTGVFPSNNNIKVIWVGVKENNIENSKTINNNSIENTYLNSLFNDLDFQFNQLGFKAEKKFSPHLTIARVKNKLNSNDKQAINDILNKFKRKRFGNIEFNKITIKKSVLTSKGPIYSDLKSFYLD